MTAYELTGLQRTYLESVRDRITSDDGPCDPVPAEVDEDGMLRWRRQTLNEQLAYAVAKWLWDEAVGE